MVYLKKVFYFLAVAISVALCVLLSTAVIQLGMMFLANAANMEISDETMYGVSGTLGVGAAGLLIWAFILKKKEWQFVEEKEPFQIGKALVYALFSVCVCKIIYANVSSWLLSYCLPLAEGDAAGAGEPLILQICMGIILAPLTEELLFRKDIYSLLVQKYSRITAIFLTTVAFAAIHGYGIQGFVSCMLAGFLFTYFYDKTGCIWYSIFAHMLCNLEALVYDLLSRDGVVFFGRQIAYSRNGYSMYHIAVFAMACIICVFLLWKQKNRARV